MLSATLGPASLGLAAAVVSVTVMDASGDVYQLAAGTRPADGRPHVLTAAIDRHGRASYPVRLTAVTIGYVLPAKPGAAAFLQVRGPALSGWAASVTSPELSTARQASQVAGGSALPAAMSWQPGRNGTSALRFSPGFGESAEQAYPGAPVFGEPLAGQVMLSASPSGPGTAIPGIATSAFLGSSSAAVGSTVAETIGGITVPVRIVAAVSDSPPSPPAPARSSWT